MPSQWAPGSAHDGEKGHVNEGDDVELIPPTRYEPRHQYSTSSDRVAEQELPQPTTATPALERPTTRLSDVSGGHQRILERIKEKGRQIGWLESLKAAAFASWLNIFLPLVPLSWVAHFLGWSHQTQFILSFFAIMPLEKLFDWGGEQLAVYCGEELGDLVVITLNNAVEVALAIILLIKCELKLLQATIAGVVLLHLLLIPGTAFMVGGARVWAQTLHPTRSQLNNTLLTIGILALLVPTAFFAAIDRGIPAPGTEGTDQAINDVIRGDFLKMGRGFAVILLFVYVCSRFYLHDPPGEDNAFQPPPDAPADLVVKERELREADPEINPWACSILLLVCVGLMSATAEWLVDSVEGVREESNISEEWFGLILLPILSWSANGAVKLVFFVRTSLKQFFKFVDVPSPTTISEARAIELSIQFMLFWMPFLVLLGWWVNKPVSVLFDLFEVTVLIGSCFLVNYVTADSKTNWAEGMMMISFYLMIALSAWFYPGQPEVRIMNACTSIVDALANAVGPAE